MSHLTKTGAYIDHPFGPDSDIVKVKGRIFAQLFYLRGIPMLTVNGDAVTNDIYHLISKYTELTELTAPLLNELVDKIVVHEAYKDEDGNRTQEIEIYYRFIGKID